MRMKFSMFRWSKNKGVSNTLGTIMFVGILMSAIIPMYLHMKQADTIYEKELLELKRLDDEMERETIFVYAYPKGASSEQIEIMVENAGEVGAEIRRVWINDTFVNESAAIQSFEETILGPYDVSVGPASNSSFKIRVTSARGNVYIPTSGETLTYSSGQWDYQVLSVNVVTNCEGFLGIAKYRVTITNNTFHSDVQETSGYVAGTQYFMFDVTEWGPVHEYHVKIEAKKIFRSWQILHEEDVEIEYPDGPPDVWVRYSPTS